jgi:hypothetical protein
MFDDPALYRTARASARHPRSFFLGILALILAWLPGAARSEQTEEETAGTHQLMFIPPPEEGVISLGVYDADGKLVRVLKRAAEIDSFKSGLNGLFIDWDGKDSKGNPAPAGKYSARGVLVGDVNVSGQAYHLNDWVDSSGTTQAKRILSAAFLNGKSVCAFAEVGTNKQLLVDASNGKYRTTDLPADTNGVKFDGSRILAICNDRLMQVDPITGSSVGEKSYPNLRAADQWNDKWIVLAGNQLYSSNNGADQGISPPKEDLAFCAQLDSSAVVAGRNGNIWRFQDHQFSPIETGKSGQLLDISAGKGDTIWLLLEVDSRRLLRQVDLSGQHIQELELPQELQTARKLCGSRDDEDLLLTIDLNPGERVIGLHFQNSKAQQSVWQKWLDRSVTPFRYFDVKNGQIVPAQEKVESPIAVIQLTENPLENGAPGSISVGVIADETGAWISTSDGLPLLQVTKTKNIVQTKWTADGADGLQVFVSDASVVEEYRVTGLKNLYRFDAGSFD